MAIIRPRLTDYYDIGVTQEEVDFAIPFLDEDIPLYVDPFLLWKSPSMQDNALHTVMLASFNQLGRRWQSGARDQANQILVSLSECEEVGLGHAKNKKGKRIGAETANEVLSLFSTIPEIRIGGLHHIEELNLLTDQIGRDRISDLACNLLKSFLIDYTIDQANMFAIPREEVSLLGVFDLRTQDLASERVSLPTNPETHAPILLVPKRWLRFVPWINRDEFFSGAHIESEDQSLDLARGTVGTLSYNRNNYGMIRAYVAAKERSQTDCRNDPLFTPIPVLSAKRKLAAIRKLPTGNDNNADKAYEDLVAPLMASMLYPQLDFAKTQSRTDSGALIRDLLFYNGRSTEFLRDIYDTYASRQIVVELKNVKSVEREHINQLNRYLNSEFGRFGIIVTRNPLPRAMFRSTIDLWSGQRRCIIALTDEDLDVMCTVFDSKQRLPLEVILKAYVEFTRSCPA